MQIGEYIKEITAILKDGGISSPALDAQVIAAHFLKMERHQLVTWNDRTVPEHEKSLIDKAVKRRLKFEPVAYITGVKEFYSLEFEVNPNVLIPRPETELLVDMAIYWAGLNSSVLDLCTGSGAIAIALKHSRGDLDVCASDISEKALETAERNAEKIFGKRKISFYQGDLFLPFKDEKFALIVSNPPYVPENIKGELQKELEFEPVSALYAGDNGTSVIKKIIEESPEHLYDNGILLLEIGSEHREFIEKTGRENGFRVSVLNDYAGLPRVATLKK
ncbi:MAG TPA: peptide chain release factor N(5)-glutamine methyltransferase [Spirochaetota bacterium]|nr:peptide chain release factor N(5)-glutamine methyltransferase [Spirochaetota bacterium]HPJ33393.1 peptide chain release factor N(5)-glutamine methyltransferase [Spirochaetota bacterium]